MTPNTELTSTTPLPAGFAFAGVHAGIKRTRPDLGLIHCPGGASVAGCFTKNPVRAACVDRNRSLLPTDGIKAVVTNSGNANAMTGEQGIASNTQMAAVVAEGIGAAAEQVLSLSTGVIGVQLNLEKIGEAVPPLVAALGEDPTSYATAILTTDTCTKVAQLTVMLPTADGGEAPVQLFGVAKGSGMIHPNMATTLGYVCTDAAVAPALLDRLLKALIDDTFNAITVDGDTSTNDSVLVMASGASGVHVESGPAVESFTAALKGVLTSLARQVAQDGEGATRLLQVDVAGAPTKALARKIARGICRGSLFKSSVFAGDLEWGRLAAAAGQTCAEHGASIDMGKIQIYAQGIQLVKDGTPVAPDTTELLRRLQAPEVKWRLELGETPTDQSDGLATAWGCDLTYDYVRINADESMQIEVRPDGGVGRNLTLGAYSPKLKHQLLVDGLAYVRKFTGMKVIVALGGAVTKKPALIDALVRDLELVVDAGMRPLVVTPSAELADEIAAGLSRGPTRTNRVDAIPAKISPWLDRGHLCLLVKTTPDPGELVSLAIKLGVGKLIALADSQGMFDERGLVTVLSPDQAIGGLKRGRFDSHADENLALARHAATQGLPALHLIDGRLPHALVAELFTDQGVGTLISRQLA